MRIKAIAGICKKSKSICLVDKESSDGKHTAQWVGDAGAFYPVDGLPYMEMDGIFTIFEIAEVQKEKFSTQHLPAVPEGGITFEDTAPYEARLESGDMTINADGRTLKPLQTSRGLVFIDTKYLAPLAPLFDFLEFYERQMASGRPYVAVKAGLILYAVIMPVNAIHDDFVKVLKEIAEQSIKTLARQKAETEAGGGFMQEALDAEGV